MYSTVLNYKELAKTHENFTFLHFLDLNTYLMRSLPREQANSICSATFAQIHTLRDFNGSYPADIHTWPHLLWNYTVFLVQMREQQHCLSVTLPIAETTAWGSLPTNRIYYCFLGASFSKNERTQTILSYASITFDQERTPKKQTSF